MRLCGMLPGMGRADQEQLLMGLVTVLARLVPEKLSLGASAARRRENAQEEGPAVSVRIQLVDARAAVAVQAGTQPEPAQRRRSVCLVQERATAWIDAGVERRQAAKEEM